MNSPAHDLALYLEESGAGTFGGDIGWSINVGTEPTSPDTAVTLYDTGGFGPDTDQLDDTPAFQVRVRAPTYTDAYDQHVLIKKALILPASIDTETSSFSLVVMTSEIASIGRDGNSRHLLVANYRSRRTSKE